MNETFKLLMMIVVMYLPLGAMVSSIVFSNIFRNNKEFIFDPEQLFCEIELDYKISNKIILIAKKD